MPSLAAHRFRACPSVRASISADGLVILDVRGGVVLSANAVGARIWQLVEQGRTAEEIEQQLVSEYGIGPDRARKDASAFLADLVSRGIVTRETQR